MLLLDVKYNSIQHLAAAVLVQLVYTYIHQQILYITTIKLLPIIKFQVFLFFFSLLCKQFFFSHFFRSHSWSVDLCWFSPACSVTFSLRKNKNKINKTI